MIECHTGPEGNRVILNGHDNLLIAEAAVIVEAVIETTAHGNADMWRTRRDQIIALIVTQAAMEGLRREA